MVASRNNHKTALLVCLLAVLLGLWLGAGCAEKDVTSPSSSRAHLTINDGPDKPSTTIQITIETPMKVMLDIRDVNSGQVRLLLDRDLDTGPHNLVWDGRDNDGVTVASGPYWAVLSSEDGVEAIAMMMIK